MTTQTNIPNNEEKKNDPNLPVPPKKTTPPVENPKANTKTTEAA